MIQWVIGVKIIKLNNHRNLPMYPLQLEKYIPIRFSRFLTVKKKRMAQNAIRNRPRPQNHTFVSPTGKLIEVILFFIIYLVPYSVTDLSNIV